MLNENLKNLRKSKGLSQEELAMKLNIVRQTISKWENGVSVPDCEMLVKIADALDTSVSVLLDESVEIEKQSEEDIELKVIATKLEILNEQIVKKNENNRKIRRFVFIVLCIVSVGITLIILGSFIYYFIAMNPLNSDISMIGGVEGPNSVSVTQSSFQVSSIIAVIISSVIVTIISVIGIYKTRRI